MPRDVGHAAPATQTEQGPPRGGDQPGRGAPGRRCVRRSGITADAAGLPAALVKTLKHGLRNETSALSLYAPRTMFNTTITGSRRFAAQGWPMERLRAIGKASDTTLNDVVLADVLRRDPRTT